MDNQNHHEADDENAYDGAIHQITPAPDNFVPQGSLQFDRKEDIVIKRKPRRNRIWASIVYSSIQLIIFGGILVNYSLFGSLTDLFLWALTIITFVAYFRVSYSDPGYVEDNIVMTEAHDYDLHAFDTQPQREETKAKERKKSVKTSILTKGLSKHSRFVKSNQGLKEHARHCRTSSVGSNVMTHSNYGINRGYAKLNDQTFKSGDFSKLKTEMEDLEFSEPAHFSGKGHRRKPSLIKKIGALHQSDLNDLNSNHERDNERSKAFNLMAERIANSRATVETEHFTHTTPPANDTNATFHKRTKSGEESKSDRTTSHGFTDDDNKGVFKAFQEETSENKQIQLASNAVTNDTENLAGTTHGIKRQIADNDFEEIKEEDENNESYDARKNFEQLDAGNDLPDVDLEKRPHSDRVFDLDGKDLTDKYKETDFDEEYKNEETQEDDHDEGDVNMLFVEQKLCTVCNIEQPLRTKHCRSCKKCVGTYDHHWPWVGNCIAEKNRKYFFVYIWIQTIQVIYGFIYTCYIMTEIQMSISKLATYWITISFLAEILFTLMLLSLVIFHTYLVLNNFTTWETLSWNKISYMRIWPRKYGSPFSRGWKENAKLYFFGKSKDRFLSWKMPKKLPSIYQGEKIIKSRKWSYLFEKTFIRC